MAWTRSSFRSEDDYLVRFTPEDRQAIVDAIRGLRGRGRLAVPIETLTKDEFAFGPLSAKLAAAYEDVRTGRGFTVMRRLPLDEALTLDEYGAAVWGIGLHFGGRMLSQNASGELLTEVVDATANDPTPRMYRSNVELRLHTDITDMLSLACWHKAQSGRALDLFDEVARMPEFRLDFDLERGDMLVINNYTVMHARGGFVNNPEPERIRRFIRLWPAGENFRKVPKEFEHFDGPGVPPQLGKSCTFDFKDLAASDPRAVGSVT
jgi:hypothetical protein